MGKLIFKLLTFVPFLSTAQVTLIPDSDFEKALIYWSFDTDGIVNGQILTSDAHNVINLDLNGVPLGHGGYIMDLSGIEGFINLEHFRAYYNNLSSVNLSTLTKLKTLFFTSNNLTTIDLSANKDLEKLVIGNGALDFGPFNRIKALDLSNNNKLKEIDAFNMTTLGHINLRNNSADTVYILLGNETNYPYKVCIEVDNHIAATNGTAPYDTWMVDGNYYFSDNCVLSVEKFVKDNFKIYPNPATQYVFIEQKETNGVTLQSVQILDSSGKWIKSIKDNFNQIDVSSLSKGIYLFVI